MDYGPSDSSGTDDDLPPSQQNRISRGGHVTGNGRGTLGGVPPCNRQLNDMESQIHYLEQEAYCSILRAFKAQSDAITWEKEGLITELRKELRVSDEEHRELLGRVNGDDTIRRIREWRQQTCGSEAGLHNASHLIHEQPSPSISASRKKQKTSQSIQPFAPPPTALHPPNITASMQPSSSVVKRGTGAGPKAKKSGHVLPGGSLQSMQYQSTGPIGRGSNANRDISGPIHTEPVEGTSFDPLIGRKVMTRWPEDNNFYQAVITDYNPDKGLHALVYDINTASETWEWVNLKEISPEDIRWEGEDPGISRNMAHARPPGRSNKKSARGGSNPGGVKKKAPQKNKPSKDFLSSQNGVGRKVSDDIEILNSDALIKEVERIFNLSHPDPKEVEKTKKLLKDQEQALVDAIARLGDASDGESESDHPFLHT